MFENIKLEQSLLKKIFLMRVSIRNASGCSSTCIIELARFDLKETQKPFLNFEQTQIYFTFLYFPKI